MGLFRLPKVCILLLAASLSAQTSAAAQDAMIPSERVLRAATRRSDVFRRSMRIAPRFDTQVSYIEKENGWNGESIFASQVKLGSEVPILHLEEIEHHLQDVHCGLGKMKLHFVDTVSARDAKSACVGDKGGRIITSHQGCNKDGERAVYKVNDVTLSADEHSLELSVVESTWKDAFKKFDIDFGYTSDDHLFRRHADFEKVRWRRQASAVPIPIPTGTPEDVNTQSFDLSSQLIDSTFALPDFVNALAPLVPLPSIPIDLKCKNCTTTGTLVLTQGAINIDLTEIVDIIPDNEKFITGGFFELAANDLSAHVELIAKPILSDTFTVNLPGLPILGFVIPGIGEAGVTFNQTLEVSYEITESIEVVYGFEVIVPSPSTIRIELTDFKKSGIVGFPDTKLTPLPFSANISEIEILLGAAYLPSIPIGFKFLDQLTAQVSVDMDLPRLDLKLSTKKNTDANCNPLESSNKTTSDLPPTAIPGLFAELGPLVLVEANVSISLDVGADFAFLLLPDGLNSFNTAVNLFQTTFQLVPSCLAAASGFAPATEIYDKLTASYATGTGGYVSPPTSTAAAGSVPCSTSTVTITLYPTATPAHSSTAPIYVTTSSEASSSAAPSSEVPVISSVIVGGGGYAPPNGTIPITSAPSGTGGYTVPSPTAPQEFTGAANSLVSVPTMNWSAVGWQALLLGVSIVTGMMVVL